MATAARLSLKLASAFSRRSARLSQKPLLLSKQSLLFSSHQFLQFNFDSPDCNVPPHIADRVQQTPKLYSQSPHPLCTIKQKIEEFFPGFEVVDNKNPLVSTTANFDSLLIPPDHVSRSRSDTYYLDPSTCLRTHTSAHQLELLKQGYKTFLCTGDVYRRDDIDKSHYPIFHQMEGVKVFDGVDSDTSQEAVMDDLKDELEGLAQHLFGPVECRWVEEYFPFTHPSLELEIWYQDDWLEVLGCGVMQPKILQDAGYDTNQVKAWAFGLGLERLAMVLFDIPDIRLFWSPDERFWNQFNDGQITQFKPYSKYPPCFKDVSFWLNNDKCFHVNELNDLLRQVGGDLIEAVELVDQFTHPKTNRESRCYRITYRSMDRSLTNEEIDAIQHQLRDKIPGQLNVELR
jgi:phenylalanyl-tRNA synthetase alpha chain